MQGVGDVACLAARTTPVYAPPCDLPELAPDDTDRYLEAVIVRRYALGLDGRERATPGPSPAARLYLEAAMLEAERLHDGAIMLDLLGKALRAWPATLEAPPPQDSSTPPQAK
jgi:hypothetical protein